MGEWRDQRDQWDAADKMKHEGFEWFWGFVSFHNIMWVCLKIGYIPNEIAIQ